MTPSDGRSMTNHLTVANPQLQALIDATPAGMMHWSGTGPDGKVCFACDNFDQRKLRTKAEKDAPEAIRGACAKRQRYAANLADRRRRIFDPLTPACSHFSERATQS
jgi:hypothetical protein